MRSMMCLLICMKKYIFLIGICAVLYSCIEKNQIDKLALKTTEVYLEFPIDEDTHFPKLCLWTFEENGNEYLAFPSRSQDILFYDINKEKLFKKVRYDIEGNNGVGRIYSFAVTDFNHIYIADTNEPVLYVTDTTGVVNSKIKYEYTSDDIPLVPAFFHTITYSPFYKWGDSIYIPQSLNPQIDVEKSPLGVLMNNSTGETVAVPLNYRSLGGMVTKPTATGGGKVSTCFDGKSFVYSFETIDSVHKISKNLKEVERYVAKSRYISHPKVEVISTSDINQIIKRKCELPAYGNLIYDKYRDVYYRFVFVEATFEDNEDYWEIYHNGRKQFSIMILDKDMKVVGETLFPEYTYNAYLFFVHKDGLYICANHFKHPDFDENTLRFQRIELVKL